MPEFCTCGAQLPPDAVFCHKCGKPQREIVEVETVAPPPPPPQLPPQPALGMGDALMPVGFHNREAMRTAFLAAVLATFLFFLSLIAWTGAGVFAVFLYRRRTRQAMDIGSCLRLGGLTGVMAFAMLALLCIPMLLILHAPGAMDAVHAAVQAVKDPQAQKALQEMSETVQSPSRLLMAYLNCFVTATFFSMTGGVLAAFFTRRINPRPPGGNTV